MKITEFPSVQVLKPENMFLLDGPDGTRIIYSPDLAKQLLKIGGTEAITGSINLSDMKQITSLEEVSGDAMVMFGSSDGNVSAKLNDAFFAMVEAASEDDISVKRANYRGKNLGSVVTDEQYAAIKDGSFKGLFLGDYWEIGGRKWRIMDFDYWWGTGDEACRTHHVVIMPDDNLYKAQMNDTNSTDGGYVGAKNRGILNSAYTIVSGVFTESHILLHREYLINGVTNGRPSAGLWYGANVDLPSEIMIHGCIMFSSTTSAPNISHNLTVDDTQLAAIKVNRKSINPNRSMYWLRDIVNSTGFACVGGSVTSSWGNASESGGVRPVFGITG